MRNLIGRFARDRRGATALEYGLICALIFLAALGAMRALGGNAEGRFVQAFQKIADAVN